MIPSLRLIWLAAGLAVLGACAAVWPALTTICAAGGILLVLVAGADAFVVGAARRVSAERATPGSAALGAWHRIRVRVHNQSGSAADIRLHDHHPAKCEVRDLPQHVRLAKRAWAELAYELKPLTRGELEFRTRA